MGLIYMSGKAHKLEKNIDKIKVISNKHKKEFEIELANLKIKMEDIITNIEFQEQDIEMLKQEKVNYEMAFKAKIMSISFSAKFLYKVEQVIKKIDSKIVNSQHKLNELQDRKNNLQCDIDEVQQNIIKIIFKLRKYDKLSEVTQSSDFM